MSGYLESLGEFALRSTRRPARYPWSERDEAKLESYTGILSDKDCAELLDRTELSIRLKRHRMKKARNAKAMS